MPSTNNQRLVCLRGLPCCGKTTYAMSMLKRNPEAIRISKAEIRDMLYKGKEWDSRIDKIATIMFMQQIKFALEHCYDIIIDDLNLNKKHTGFFAFLAKQHNYTYESIDFDTPVQECIRRDNARPNGLGRDTILNLAYKHNYIHTCKDFVIYTLDGTLVNNTNRKRFAETSTGATNWDLFYDEHMILCDEPINYMISLLLDDAMDGNDIYIFAARPESCRKVTEQQLKQHNIPYCRLLMRPDGDDRSDNEVFRELLNTYTIKSSCVRVRDSSQYTQPMWEEEGVKVVMPVLAMCDYDVYDQ